ncbi:HNH endonuclease [Hahella chejuensis]
MDHIWPKARGGDDQGKSLRAICKGCHRCKTTNTRQCI